jgi:hypothetical protein
MLEKINLSPEDFGGADTSTLESFKGKLPITLEELNIECSGDELLEELLEDTLKMCLRYTQTVFDMNVELGNSENGVKTDKYREISAQRGRINDTTMESIDILARTLKKVGKNSEWVNSFGGDRSAYGRFAILLTFSRMKEKEAA